MTFAEKVQFITLQLHNDNEFLPSDAQICDAMQPLVDELLTMEQKDVWAYICQDFRNVGHESLVIRMYKQAIDATQLMSR